MAEFRSARAEEGITVVSLRSRRSPLYPLAAAVATAAAVTVGLAAAAPGLADQVRDHEWWLTEVHVTQAWRVSRGTGVTVAVLDTGVDPAQPDLLRSVVTGPDYTHSGRLRGGIYWGTHGTAMAVLITGHGHGPGQADGIIGVAPGARILSVRVILEKNDPLNADAGVASSLPGAIAAGIGYAVSHGAQVIDLPLDPGPAGTAGAAGTAAGPGGSTGGSVAERNAVAYALAKGAILIAPAGDDGPGRGAVNYPAAYPGVISVGAFGKGFVKARFSSRRPYVTLTAPGEGVITAASAAGYTTMSSTSAASAEVAGMAALIRARYPGLTPEQVRQALTAGARFGRPAGRDDGSGYGTADAQRALSTAATIETAREPASPAPAAQAPAAPHNRAALLREAIICACALLLLFLLILLAWARRQRKRPPSIPAYVPQPPQSLSAAFTGSSQGACDDAEPLSAALQQRPQLGPIPKLEAGRRSTQPEGPPWEPAPRPDSEPPWGPPDSVTGGNGAARGTPHQAGGPNGRNDASRRASPGPAGPPSQRDPAAGPIEPPVPDSRVFGVPPALAAGEPPLRTPPAPDSGAAGFSAPPAAPSARPSEAQSAPEADGLSQNGSPAGTAADPPRPRRTGDDGVTADLKRGTGPIYVWNPGAKTEDFRAVPGGQPQDDANTPPRQVPFAGYPDAAPPGADTEAFPALPPAGRGSYPDDDEDDRHL